jgi:hypothetical protein
MNISLTWANYALIVGVCLAIYYLVVLVFFRKSFTRASVIKTSDILPSLFGSLTEEIPVTNSKNPDLFGEEMGVEDLNYYEEDHDVTPDAHAFADELQAYTSSCGEDVGKEELIYNLRKIIQKYPSLAGSSFRYELSQLIAISSENNCSIHLSADELSELWNGWMEQ